ncbi:hypothetical protein ACFQ0B_27005 [Nonomuraea thailandensis]
MRRLVAVTGVVDVGTRTASGEPFTPSALGSDGAVLGLTPGGAAAEAPASGGAARDAGFSAQAGLGAAEGLRTWTEDGEQRCRTPDGTTHTISPQGADPRAPVWVDGGAIAGSDVMRQPWVAAGCGEPGRTLTDDRPAAGTAVAFSYPYLFTVEPANDRKLRLVDVRTLAVAAEHPLPEGCGRTRWAGRGRSGTRPPPTRRSSGWPGTCCGRCRTTTGGSRGRSARCRSRARASGPG